MKDRSIIFIAGARPNFVKIGPILRAMESQAPGRSVLVHTGQHYDFTMSGVFFEQLGIRSPDVHLDVGSGSHGAQVGAIMTAFERLLLDTATRPSGVVVVGDVNSTMATALVAVKLGIPVAHVEAGLRSFDRSMPEEINRIVTDAVANLLLVSEPSGLANLAHEGIDPSRVRYVGNVMIDSLVEQLPHAQALDMPGKLGLARNGYALATIHRPANVDVDARLQGVIEFMTRLGHTMPVIFPVHPRTKRRLLKRGIVASDAVRLLEPLGYREFLSLLEAARVVVTDSGGVQEETSYLGVPCITLRENTERPVTTLEGTNQLAGNDLESAWKLATAATRRPRREIRGWDGRAAERIVAELVAAWT